MGLRIIFSCTIVNGAKIPIHSVTGHINVATLVIDQFSLLVIMEVGMIILVQTAKNSYNDRNKHTFVVYKDKN